MMFIFTSHLFAVEYYYGSGNYVSAAIYKPATTGTVPNIQHVFHRLSIFLPLNQPALWRQAGFCGSVLHMDISGW